MPRLKVTYEIDGVLSDRTASGVGKHVISGSESFRIPTFATVEEIIPAFQPGFYRKFVDDRWEYFWLTNNTSTGYVDVYDMDVTTEEPSFDYNTTKPWKSIHRLYERVWFQPVDKGIADGTATAEQV